MPPLYIIQQGAKIRVSNRRIKIEQVSKSGETTILAQVPISHVSQVILFGNISLTTPAINLMLKHGIEVVFLTRGGVYRGHLTSGLTPHVPLRRAQYAALGDKVFVLEMAKGIVSAKLCHQRALLIRHNRELENEEIRTAITILTNTIEKIPRKTQLSSLRGIEGAGAAAYFRGFKRLFETAWQFSKRQRRPPPDPINAMLSFGYTLLAQIAAVAVQSVGLDPYAGFLHQISYNKPALGLDLMEEFRPVIDGIVLWCSRTGQIKPVDFMEQKKAHDENEIQKNGVLLSEEGRRRFLKAFEDRFNRQFTHPIAEQKLPLRHCITEQARQIRHRVEKNQPGYQKMGFR